MKKEQKKIAGATLTISFFTLLSRILGFTRDLFIANFLGTSNLADAFFVAFRIPNLFRRLLGEGALSAAFIPVFTEYQIKQEKNEAKEFLNSAFSFFFVVLFLLLILGETLTHPLVKITAPGFCRIPEKFTLTVKLTRVTFPYIFFIGLTILTMALLNAIDHFAVPAFSPALLNISMITCLLLAGPLKKRPVFALAWGVFIGGILQLSLHLFTIIKKGWRPRFTIKMNHPGLAETICLMLPAVFGLAINQINTFVDTILASLLPPGSVSYLYYANRLVQLPLALFGIAVGTAILPTLSRHSAEENKKALNETLTFGISFVLFITLPAMLWLLIFSTPTISVLFQRGAFGWSAAKATGAALFCYALGLWSYAMVKVIVPVYYSKKDMRTPVKISGVVLFLNIGLDLLLMIPLKHAGLALATAISSAVNLTALLYFLKRKKICPNWSVFFLSLKKTAVPLALLGVGSALYLLILPYSPMWRVFVKAAWILGAMTQAGGLFLLGALLSKPQELDVLLSVGIFRKSAKKEC